MVGHQNATQVFMAGRSSLGGQGMVGHQNSGVGVSTSDRSLGGQGWSATKTEFCRSRGARLV